NGPPATVSPGSGRRSARTTRSTLIDPTTRTRPLTTSPAPRTASRTGDELGAVHADDLTADEPGPLARQSEDRVGHVLRRGHPAGRVASCGRLDDRARLRDLHKGRRERDAGADRVRRDARVEARQLHRPLADMRFEGGLRRRDDAVAG